MNKKCKMSIVILKNHLFLIKTIIFNKKTNKFYKKNVIFQ